jgi:group I intron endonuclease
MGRPTIFYILENETLNSFWVGRITTTEDCPFRSITQDELNERLYNKYTDMNPYLTLVTLNKNWNACYGVERWLSKLDYKINKEPEKYKEVKNLLMAGWDDYTETSTLSVMHILRENQPINNFYKRLVSEREPKGMRCLNTIKFETRSERYQRQKCEPDFLKHISREKVLKTMEKTKKLPKPETLAKYEIKEDELREIMGPQQVTDERLGIIYKITSPSGKVYVGQTIRSLKIRMQHHKSKYSECTLLKRAIDKYGDEMKYEIIEDNIPQEQLDEREIYWIKELNSLAPNGYNCDTGGSAYRTASQVTKDKISNTKRKSSIDKKGYIGDVVKCGNVFRPRIGKFYLSIGAFHSKEDAIEVLKEYTKDPENFSKPEGTYKKPIGHVHKRGNTWQLLYKKKHLGNYATQEEAEEARQALQSS